MDELERARVGAALEHTRRGLGFMQVDVARACDVSHGTVSLWEMGQREPRMSEWIAIAGLFKMELQTLLERVGYPLDREAPTFRTWHSENAHRWVGGVRKKSRPGAPISGPGEEQSGHSRLLRGHRVAVA